MVKSKIQSVVVVGMALVVMQGVAFASTHEERISASAKKSYVFMTYLKNDDIRINVSNDSVVTISGTVSEWSHRVMARESVAGLPGVKGVENKLEVKGGEPAENSDGWVSTKVKTSLMLHRDLNGLQTEVSTKNGVVTLRGKATSEAQKELSGEYAKDVGGVKSVINEMMVTKPEKSAMEKASNKVSDFIDDASITAQVKMALLFHRSTSVLATSVDTKDGIVTVKGVAKSSAEKTLVSKLVGDIMGVKTVKNEMTIG